MSYCVQRRGKRTRLALGILLLGSLFLASGGLATAGEVAANAQATLRGGGAPAGLAQRSVLDRFGDFLSGLTAGGRPAAQGAAPRSGLHAMHGGAGCGIDPNGVYRCT
jgi:hypothetical protein